MKDKENKPLSHRDEIEQYLKDNLKDMQSHLDKNEELYNEVKELYNDATKTATFANLKNSVEIANTLSKIRSTGIDASDKLFKMKSNIIQLSQQQSKIDNERENFGEQEQLISKLNEMINTSDSFKQQAKNISKANKSDINKQDEKEMLDKIIEDKFATGELKQTNNDKLAFNKYKSITKSDESDSLNYDLGEDEDESN